MASADKSAMERILDEEDLGHLAMAAEGELYAIPLNYTYSEGRILFHCALQGRKLAMIASNPEVCFVVSRQEGRPAPHPGELCDADSSATFESVICWGRARIIEDVEGRQAILEEFQARYHTPTKKRPAITVEQATRCGAVEIVVHRMTGRRGGGEKSAWTWEE